MAALVDQVSGAHFAHFIDAIGELEAAILHMDGGVAMGHVAAVHIGNAGHDGRTHLRQTAR